MDLITSKFASETEALVLTQGGAYELTSDGYLVSAQGGALRLDILITASFDLVLDGTIRAATTSGHKGIFVESTVSDANISIGLSGNVSGGYGVFAASILNLSNAGSIMGVTADAVNIVATGDQSITNSGLIWGAVTGIYFGQFASGLHTIDNSGIISGTRAINAEDNLQSVENITNTGTINGDIFLGGGDDVVNSVGGQIIGTVNLGDGANQFSGGRSDDNVIGGADGDILDGGIGDDTLEGGGGNDIYHIDSQADVVIEADGDNADFIYTSVSYVLSDTVHVEGVIAKSGAGNISLTGNVFANAIYGNEGNNLIDCSIADGVLDELHGDLGDDTYDLGGETLDFVSDTGGNDTIRTYTSRNLTNYTGVENLTLYDTFKANLIGNTDANVLTGNAAKNTLVGDDGGDVLIGGVGGDRLEGDAGADTFDFDVIDDSGITKALRDTILDFTTKRDRIDVSDIDAIAGGLDNSFTLDGLGKGTTAVARGHIGYQFTDKQGSANDLTLLRFNVDNDADIDMTIALSGLHHMKVADFLL
jgi:Ca2+-binding RTX toxin-like protein